MKLSDIPTNIERLADDCEAELSGRFAEIDRVSRVNTRRIMEAFQEFKVSESCFAGTTGYGYDDLGRETLDKIWARVFGAEAALVRTGFVNGTHAIASALFAAVGPGETLMCLMGAPYDTLRTAIGISGDAYGSLGFYGVKYAEVPTKNGGPDMEAIEREVGEKRPRAVLIQRSRGYDSRRALSAEEVGEICRLVKRVSPDTVCVVDNCYGEFTEEVEPTMLGAGRCGHHRRLAHQEPGRRTCSHRRLHHRPQRAGGTRCVPAHSARHRRRMRLHAGYEQAALSGPVHGSAHHGSGAQDRGSLRSNAREARL